MKDITEFLAKNTPEKEAIDSFINGADQGSTQPKKVVNKSMHTTLAFSTKQREFFELVKAKVIEKVGKLSVPKFLLFLWHYHTSNTKCVYNHYLQYSLFISSSPKDKSDLKNVSTTWNSALVPLKQQLPIAELTYGRIGSKGLIILFVLHYAKNELDIDLTPYLNQ